MSVKIPLRKVLGKLAEAREHHLERNQPSGFGFALADRIDYLDAHHWDGLAAHGSFFLRRPFLKALEDHGPENLATRYALAFKGPKPVAAVAVQLVDLSADRLFPPAATTAGDKSKARLRRALAPWTAKVSARIQERLAVCGNLLSWGRDGVAFAPDEDPAELWPAVAEAVYRIRRAERLSGQVDFALVKDLPGSNNAGVESLRRFSYRPIETDPNMVLEIDPRWRSYNDYLASLDGKYRKGAQQVIKKIEAAGCVVERLEDVAAHAGRLHDLYLQVQANNGMRLFTLRREFLPAIAGSAGESFRCNVVRRGEEILGFVTTVHDGETGVGWYIGFDRAAAAELPLYLRLLHAEIADVISLGCRRLSLGRTALEPKARLGAKPDPMQVWVRHRIPALNLVMRGLLGAIPHDEAPERNPFKTGTSANGE